MFTINKLRTNDVIDYAAQELKKYLRMMMPEGGEIDIFYDPQAKDGFRLGLLEDFGLPNDVEDPILDDIIHVDTTAQGGILAGSNPRSVLFSVYRLLKENGCRWLYPGIDGEYIPTKDIEGVQYHKVPDHRVRGFCDEGSETQTSMLECAEFYPKLELNSFFLEWFTPNGYYNRYYTHLSNETNRIPEELDDRQILQWRRQLETEINKRGLLLAGVGHGWSCRAFGFPENNNATNTYDDLNYTEEQMSVLALRDGKREWFRNRPIFTNLCMSQERVQDAFANTVADYAEAHQNYDYLRVNLSDGSRNHCECEECQKMRPADWYLRILNKADAELTKRGLRTRLTFGTYLDTYFAPEYNTLHNQQRFMMSYAPIGRNYTSSIGPDSVLPPVQPYIRNKWDRSKMTTEGTFAMLKEWKTVYKGPIFNFEYHFWRHQFLDPGVMTFARRIYEDVRSLQFMGINGCIEDGSQRSGFPNGFAVYVYAATLMDRNVEFDALVEDYFSHAYGQDWEKVVKLLEKISQAFDFAYMEGAKSADPAHSDYYNPDHVQSLQKVFELTAYERSLVKKHLNMPYRPQTISWRLLLRHVEYCELMARLMIEKAQGNDFRAVEIAKEFADEMGKYELELERYYDHGLACRVTQHLTRKPVGGFILD